MPEDKKFQNQLKLCGFKRCKSAFFNSQDFKNLRNVFLDNLPNIYIPFPDIKPCSLSKVKQVGKDILENHANGIDLKIPYTMEDDLESSLIETFGNNPDENQIENIIEFIKNNMELKKITDIPIFLNLKAHKNGYVTYPLFYTQFTNSKFYKNLPIIFSSIGLNGPCDDFSKVIYIHEIYHILSQRNKGYAQNYLYDEFLSIFMEQITALDINPNLIKSAFLKRTLNIKNTIINLIHDEFYNENKIDIIDEQKYILSFLLAYCLFNTYLHSSNKGKKQIDNEINKVLMGSQILEDLFDKYELTPEKGANIVKRKIKTLK